MAFWQFPPDCLEFSFPSWFDVLEQGHPCKRAIFQAIRETAPRLTRVCQSGQISAALEELDTVSQCAVSEIDLGSGTVRYRVSLPQTLFYEILSQRSGVPMENDGDLLRTLSRYAEIRDEHERLRAALEQVQSTGYGIVMPEKSELTLQKPELIKKGGAWGVRLQASAPSIHLLRADLAAELSPIVGGEDQAKELAQRLTESAEGEEVWESNLFGKSLYELVNERMTVKMTGLPEDARMKLRRALERIVNEGANGLICLVL